MKVIDAFFFMQEVLHWRTDRESLVEDVRYYRYRVTVYSYQGFPEKFFLTTGAKFGLQSLVFL